MLGYKPAIKNGNYQTTSFKDTHRENAPSNKTETLTKSMSSTYERYLHSFHRYSIIIQKMSLIRMHALAL